MKYSDKSHREYTLMHIREEYYHPPKSTLTQNAEILVRELMEIFLSDRIIRTTRRNKITYGREKSVSFRSVIDSIFF